MTNILITLLLTLCVQCLYAADVDVKVIALFSNKALLQVGGEQKVVSKGETFEGVLLESATGRGAVVIIDGKRRELGLNQSIAGNFKKPDRSRMRIYPDSGGMYFVNGAINDQRTRFLVDTGATYVTMSGKKARSLDIDFFQGKKSNTQTASAVVPTWRIILNSVSIGGISLSNVSATVIEGEQPYDVLLGNSFLKHIEMQRAGVVLEIKQRF